MDKKWVETWIVADPAIMMGKPTISGGKMGRFYFTPGFPIKPFGNDNIAK